MVNIEIYTTKWKKPVSKGSLLCECELYDKLEQEHLQ